MVNSGTNNWFINLSDNTFLDTVDEGFTVFGEVLGNGMEIVDAISEVPTLPLNNSNGQPIFTTVPFVGDLSNGVTEEDFVVIHRIAEVELRAGDYNRDGVVDLGDYTVWRDTLGSTTLLAADGNNSGTVDGPDFAVWRNDFGLRATPKTTGSLQSSSVPEPGGMPTLLGLSILFSVIRSTKCRNRWVQGA
jgi:hypothetical protein